MLIYKVEEVRCCFLWYSICWIFPQAITCSDFPPVFMHAACMVSQNTHHTWPKRWFDSELANRLIVAAPVSTKDVKFKLCTVFVIAALLCWCGVGAGHDHERWEGVSQAPSARLPGRAGLLGTWICQVRDDTFLVFIPSYVEKTGSC